MIHTGDCVEVMASLEAESVDAIVTDPPYGLEFMGKEWDRLGATHEHPDDGEGPWGRTERVRYGRTVRGMQSWHERWAREAFRVAKPGAHLLAFGGTRTYHRLASAIEDAGWEIRDCLVWAYASGFPKSLDVSKAIDKAAGAEREIVGEAEVWGRGVKRFAEKDTPVDGNERVTITAPATPEAAKWNGWGTALKPAWEPIVLARKPLVGTVAQNVTRFGTGALNIDGTRIPADYAADYGETWLRSGRQVKPDSWQGPSEKAEGSTVADRVSSLGRWPANLILTDPIFDGDTPGVVGGGDAGDRGGGFYVQPPGKGYTGSSLVGASKGEHINAPGREPWHYGDSGTYSRFFLIPKEDRAGREPNAYGAGALEEREAGGHLAQPNGKRMGRSTEEGANVRDRPSRLNGHPTVKPLDLMRHLIRLVTPPGGLVLDPFLGSGTTALACEMEGFRWIGIEKEADYVKIAEARLNGVQKGLGLSA